MSFFTNKDNDVAQEDKLPEFNPEGSTPVEHEENQLVEQEVTTDVETEEDFHDNEFDYPSDDEELHVEEEPVVEDNPLSMEPVSEEYQPVAESGVAILERAQRLHDEYVREGEEARELALKEAEEIRSNAIQDAENESRSIQDRISELKAFEEEYIARIRALSERVLDATSKNDE